jgi:hypothetical protein
LPGICPQGRKVPWLPGVFALTSEENWNANVMLSEDLLLKKMPRIEQAETSEG